MNTALLRSQLNTATQIYRERGEAYPPALADAVDVLHRLENYEADFDRFTDDYESARENLGKLVEMNPWLPERKRSAKWIKDESFVCWNYGVETRDTHEDMAIRDLARKNLSIIEQYEQLGGKLYTAQANCSRLKSYLDKAFADWQELMPQQEAA